jgi:hypothetical protein
MAEYSLSLVGLASMEASMEVFRDDGNGTEALMQASHQVLKMALADLSDVSELGGRVVGDVVTGVIEGAVRSGRNIGLAVHVAVESVIRAAPLMQIDAAAVAASAVEAAIAAATRHKMDEAVVRGLALAAADAAADRTPAETARSIRHALALVADSQSA